MSLMLARRSRIVFRHLNVTESSLASGRVSLPLRNCQWAAGSSSSLGPSKSGVFGTLLPSIASNSYATAVAKPKAHTGKTKASSKTKSSTSSKAGAKKPAKTAAKTKPKAIGRPKKEVSKEEKDALKEKHDIKELKKAVLKAPKQLPSSVFSVVLAEIIREKGISGPPAAKEASEAYKNLTPQQRQEHEQTAESNKSLNQAAYEAWVQSHTPLQIKEANRARVKLKKLAAKDESKVTSKGLSKIVDPRQVKAPSNAIMFYNSEQRASGNFNHLSIGEAAKELSKQFAQLTDHQKEKYIDMAARDKARYYKQYKEVYGVDAPSTTRKDRMEA